MSVREYGRLGRPDELEAALVGWLASEVPAHAPTELAEQVLRATAQVRQRSRLIDLPAFDLRPRRLAFAFTFAAAVVALVSLVATVVLPRLDPGPAGPLVPAGELIHPRAGHTATLLPDGRVLIVGGVTRERSVAPAELWDPRSRSFEPAGSMIEPRFDHTASLLPDGRVLIVGGTLPREEGTQELTATPSAEIWDPAGRSFSPAGTLAQARRSHTATSLPDGRVLIAGGTRGTGTLKLASVEIWDPLTSRFEAAGEMVDYRSSHTATLLQDGRVLFVGGNEYPGTSGSLRSAELWSPDTGTFELTGSLAIQRMYHRAALLHDGRVLVVGGTEGTPATNVVEVWDPRTGSFSAAGTIGREQLFITWHQAVTLNDGRVAVISPTDEPTVEIWDPATETATNSVRLPERRISHTATVLPDGRVLIVGGLGRAGSGDGVPVGDEVPVLGSALLWDPSAPPEPDQSGPLVPAGELAHPRAGHTATLLPEGRVLVIGGRNLFGRTPEDVEALTSAEIWDPLTRTWSAAGSTIEPRIGHTATLLSDGRVLVVGGGPSELIGREPFIRPLAVAEIWDPATRSFSPAGELIEARALHTATLLEDGRVLIAGGGGGGARFEHIVRSLGSTEIWHPVSQAFQPTAPLSESRIQHTATRLPDGRVLIVGVGVGVGRFQERLASAEVWDPATATSSPTGSLAKSRQGHTATPLSDGRVLIVGGMEIRDHARAFAEVWDAASGTFEQAGLVGRPGYHGPYGHQSVLLNDGRVALLGPLPEIELWDPTTLSLSPSIVLPGPRSEHTATALPDGRVLIVGGIADAGSPGEPVTLGSALLWDPSAPPEPEQSPAEPVEPVPLAPAGIIAEARVGHTATPPPDGRVLVVGGEELTAEGNRIIDSAEIWDPATRTFSAAGTLNEPRQGHSTFLLPDGRVAIVGGRQTELDGRRVVSRRALSSVEVWDPTTNSFAVAGELLQPRAGRTSTMLPDGRIFIVGGTTGTLNFPQPLRTAEIWDPSTGSSEEAGQLVRLPGAYTATALPDGRVLVTGEHRAEIWDPVTASFSEAGALTFVRASSATTSLLPGGRVLIFGGAREVEPGGRAELWDPETDEFSVAGVIDHPGFWSGGWTASVLDDGRVAIVGGESDAMWLWDPETNEFSEAVDVGARFGHTATTLADGRVLVVGGMEWGDGDMLDEAFLYDPLVDADR